MDRVERLKKQRDSLQKQWDLVHEKLDKLRTSVASENDTSSKFKLKQQIEEVELELDSLDQRLDELEGEIQSFNKKKQLDAVKTIHQDIFQREKLYKVLLGLDYTDHVRLFRSFLNTRQAAVFLIQGSSEDTERSLQLLLKRLLGVMKQGGGDFPLLKTKLSSKVRRRDISAIWRDLGREFGASFNASNQEIAIKVCERLQREHVILLFDDLDRLDDINQFIKDFWQILVKEVQKYLPKAHNCQLLMFLVDYNGCVSDTNFECIDKYTPTWQPHTPIRLPLVSQFSMKILIDWVTSLVEDLPDEFICLENYVEYTVNQILPDGNHGVPDMVIKRICDIWGFDLHDEETSRWLEL